MTKNVLALAVVAVLLLEACTRAGSGGGGPMPAQVYAAGLTVQDVRSTLASDTWWPGTPSFKIRPLGLPTMAETVRFGIAQHFVHFGSSELLITEHDVYNSTSAASTIFTQFQNNQATVPGPKAGDQSIYYGSKSPTDTALYDTDALVRVGAVLITIALLKGQGFADLAVMGRLANKLVSRLNAATKGLIRPSPLPSNDAQLLLPLGTEVTLVAAVRLPIESVPELLGAGASPEVVADSLTSRGLKDFLFGDYALDADLNMEVRAIVFTFSSPSDATSWADLIIGPGNLDAQGVASGYSSSIGEYFAFILAGSHVGVLFCNSLSPYEAASRACETPMSSLIGAWQTRLA